MHSTRRSSLDLVRAARFAAVFVLSLCVWVAAPALAQDAAGAAEGGAATASTEAAESAAGEAAAAGAESATSAAAEGDDFFFEDDGTGASDESAGDDETSVARRPEPGPGIGEKTFDAVVLRPIQTLGLVSGAGLFVPAAIITSPGGRPLIEEAWDYFVIVSYEEAWKRPLGRF